MFNSSSSFLLLLLLFWGGGDLREFLVSWKCHTLHIYTLRVFIPAVH